MKRKQDIGSRARRQPRLVAARLCCQRGALMVEFVFAFVIATLLIFAIIQYGVIVFDVNALNHIARETARYAAVHGAESTALDPVTDPVSIRAEIQNLCATSPISYNNITNTAANSTPYLITYNWQTGTNPSTPGAVGQAVTITIKYNMAYAIFLKPFIPGLTNWSYMTVQASNQVDVTGQTQ